MTAPTETPSLTTKQARTLATRWVTAKDPSNAMVFVSYALRTAEREQLFAWVRAYADEATAGGLDASDTAASLSAELNLDGGERDEQQATELLLAAGWHS